MNIQSTPIEGLKIIELKIFKDERGYFNERFQVEKFKNAGLPYQFVQDNHSYSKANVLRGLHFQNNPDQGKLVGTIQGSIWDVAVDLRKGSPTFGKHFGLELSSENGLTLWIPGGFAHGFCVLNDEGADVLYKVDTFYNPQKEVGVSWNDPDLNIPWPVKKPIVSERDQKLPSFKEYLKTLAQ